MRKKATKSGKAAARRKRPAVKDLLARHSEAAKGGIALLVPAVQAAREAATRSTTIADGTSNTILGA
jgi:hypothetical protein